jgi:hypothetical protein
MCTQAQELLVTGLTLNLNVLPENQREVWKRLGATPGNFVLYGGTALALRLGHRESIDFDFFSHPSFQPSVLLRSIPYLEDQTVTQLSESTLSCDIATTKGVVKVSFFGGLSLGQISAPDLAESNGIAIASLKDLFGMKCATVPQRNEVKDYRDIHALIVKGKIELAEGVAAARAIYGKQYNPVLTLQALSYYGDLSEQLPASVKADLMAAVKSVSLQNLPTIAAPQSIGEGIRRSSP